MPRISMTEAIRSCADVAGRVRYAGERFVLTKHGKPIAAFVSLEDLKQLEQRQAAAKDSK